MKNLTVLLFCLSSGICFGASKTLYLEFKAASVEELVHMVDASIEKIYNGRLMYRNMPLWYLYDSHGCRSHKKENIKIKGLAVRKAFRINKHQEVERFEKGVLKVIHTKCIGRRDED